MKKHNFKIGQTVYIKPSEFERSKGVVDTKISKVGRKYIYVERHNRKFEVDTLDEVVISGVGGKLYTNTDTIKEEERIRTLYHEIKNKFQYSSNPNKITPEQVEAIAKILGII